jgi:elongation factor Ts
MLSPLLFWKSYNDRDKEKPPSSKSASLEHDLKKKKEKLTKHFAIPQEIRSENNQPTSMSSAITTEQVKALRDQTGISVMQCKKALEEAGGDTEKALVILRKKSGELAAKKGDRTFGAGTVQAYIHATGTVGAIVELNCETDFVANNEEFKALARDIAMHVTATNPKFLNASDIKESDMKAAREVFEEEVKGKPAAMKDKILQGKLDTYFAEMVLGNQPFIKNPEITIQGLVDAAVQKFGEKTAIARFKRFKVLEN